MCAVVKNDFLAGLLPYFFSVEKILSGTVESLHHLERQKKVVKYAAGEIFIECLLDIDCHSGA